MSERQLIDEFVRLARGYQDPKTLLGPGDEAAVIEPSHRPVCNSTDQFDEKQHFRHR